MADSGTDSEKVCPPEKVEKAVTIEVVRAAMSAKSDEGKTAQVKALLMKYDAGMSRAASCIGLLPLQTVCSFAVRFRVTFWTRTLCSPSIRIGETQLSGRSPSGSRPLCSVK